MSEEAFILLIDGLVIAAMAYLFFPVAGRRR